jgi:hypothetical protein
VSCVQPRRHWNVSGLHTGAAVPQSLFERHATHAPLATWQRGAPVGQSLLARHCTQSCVVVLHTGRIDGQSFATLQPMQSPDAWSQIGARIGQLFAVQAAWHLWSEAQHAGVVPPQSALVLHWTHAPCVHTRAVAGQSAALKQSTHPRIASHICLPGHCIVPLGPQSALPGPGPPVVLLPPEQATRRPTTVSAANQIRASRVLLMDPSS